MDPVKEEEQALVLCTTSTCAIPIREPLEVRRLLLLLLLHLHLHLLVVPTLESRFLVQVVRPPVGTIPERLPVEEPVRVGIRSVMPIKERLILIPALGPMRVGTMVDRLGNILVKEKVPV